MNTKLNVVRFENTDILTTSVDPHAKCIDLTFTADNIIRNNEQENIHYHVSGTTLTTANRIKVGEDVYSLKASSGKGPNHNTDLCILNGNSWNIHNGTDYADFAAGLSGHYVLDADGVTYVKE